MGDLHLEIYCGTVRSKSETFSTDVIKVGKLTSSQLRLEDPDVSRIHAVIERSTSGWTVLDLGSGAGTFLNGEKVTRSSFSEGDELRFGGVLVRCVTTNTSTALAHSATSEPLKDPDASVARLVTTGSYDEQGNYHPGYYDHDGVYQYGHGYYDDDDRWCVVQGHYNVAGNWFAADAEQFESSGLVGLKATDENEMYDAYTSGEGGEFLEVTMLWNDRLLTVSTFQKPRTITVGNDTKNDFVVENDAMNVSSHPLFHFDGTDYSLAISTGMQGHISDGNVTTDVAEIAAGLIGGDDYSLVALRNNMSIRVEFSGTTFLAHFTDLPTVVAGVTPIDVAPVPYIGGSGIVHVMLLVLAMMMPDTARSLELDQFALDDRFVQMTMTPDEPEDEPAPDWADEAGGEAASKHKGEEGKSGREDAPDSGAKLAIRGDVSEEDIEIKKARDLEIAMSAGIAQQLMVSSPFTNSDTSIGSDAIHALGNLDGESAGDAFGFNGMGLSDAGRGGAGDENGIGLSDTALTDGIGGKDENGKRHGGNPDLGPKRASVPKDHNILGKPEMTGGLDAEIIRRIVRQHRREIKFCYETQLQKDKSLAGRVTMKFTIAANGSVVSSRVKSSTLKNASVESCMAGKIRRWVFPEPKGGGLVIVSYPFNLKS